MYWRVRRREEHREDRIGRVSDAKPYHGFINHRCIHYTFCSANRTVDGWLGDHEDFSASDGAAIAKRQNASDQKAYGGRSKACRPAKHRPRKAIIMISLQRRCCHHSQTTLTCDCVLLVHHSFRACRRPPPNRSPGGQSGEAGKESLKRGRYVGTHCSRNGKRVPCSVREREKGQRGRGKRD